jgi:hypothetical protein
MQRHVEHKHSTRKAPRKKKETQARSRHDTIPVQPRNEGEDKPQDEKRMEGEGSYTAGRRYDKGASEFAKTGEVERSAREAANDLTDDELLDGGPSIDEEGIDEDTRVDR